MAEGARTEVAVSGERLRSLEEAFPRVFVGAKRHGPVFITDCLGHFTVSRPVLLVSGDTAEDATPTLLMFNSMGGDYTRNVIVTALFNMLFEGADETSDELFLHSTHV